MVFVAFGRPPINAALLSMSTDSFDDKVSGMEQNFDFLTYIRMVPTKLVSPAIGFPVCW